MARVRSPNYPSLSLPDAIQRVRKVYEKEHLHKAPPEVVCKAMGYTGVNGASLGVLSALKKYGLLEEVGKDLKVSQQALTILVDPPHSQERADAIRKAAQAPALFELLFAEFGEGQVSDENLRAFLLKRGFAPSAVDTPIRSYRETLAFVSQLAPYNRAQQPAIQQAPKDESANMDAVVEQEPEVHQRGEPEREAPPPVGIKRDVWDLDEGKVVLERPAELGEESLEYLEAWLNLLMKKIKKERIAKTEPNARRRVDLSDGRTQADTSE